MLVGQRRRLLNYLQKQRPRGLPRARSASSACAGERSIAPGHAGARLLAHDARTGRRSRRTTSRADDRPGLLPVRLQPGLHRPAPGLRGGAATSSPRSGATLYGVSATRRSRRRRSARSSASRSRSCRTSSPRARRRARSAPTSSRGGMTDARAGDRRPRRRRAWSLLGRHPGDLPGVNLIFDGLAASSPPESVRRSAPSVAPEVEDRLDVARARAARRASSPSGPKPIA